MAGKKQIHIIRETYQPGQGARAGTEYNCCEDPYPPRVTHLFLKVEGKNNIEKDMVMTAITVQM